MLIISFKESHMTKNVAYLIEGEILKLIKSKSPILLGLSGGPDSLFLFYVLLELKNKGKITFIVAHINHGWRKESDAEHKELARLCDSHQIPFYSDSLKKVPQKNMEEEGRKVRIGFFRKIYSEKQCQALVLGHHRDDRAETVIKKILEGTSLDKLNSFQKVSNYEEIVIWRPLLTIPKTKIVEALIYYGKEGFNDSTNLNSQFLRGRMRTMIIPFLEKEFGKGVVSNIFNLAEEAQELQRKLNKEVNSVFPSWEEGPWGRMVDLTTLSFKELIEWKQVARVIFNGIVSKSLILQLATLLKNNKANAKLFYLTYSVIVDRRRVFILQNPLPSINYSITVTKGVKEKQNSSWKEWWQGECWAAGEEGEYSLEFLPPTKTIDKRLTNDKVPAFFRTLVPFLYKEGLFYKELLTGRDSDMMELSTFTINITSKSV
jgi:tRNA(Ile)-lysidine synthase